MVIVCFWARQKGQMIAAVCDCDGKDSNQIPAVYYVAKLVSVGNLEGYNEPYLLVKLNNLQFISTNQSIAVDTCDPHTSGPSVIGTKLLNTISAQVQ